MPIKKSLQKITMKEMEDIFKCLENKFTQDREEFEKFLPEVTPIFDSIRPVTRKKKQTKTMSERKEKTETKPIGFTLFDAFLTEREKKVRYDNAIKIIHKFRQEGALTENEMKKCIENAALVDFEERANSVDVQSLIRIVERLLDSPLTDETERQVVFADSTPTKEYKLTDRINVHLNRDFSLVRIEILKHR